MRDFRHVVFDLDGTLVDSLRDIGAAVNDALAQVAPGTPPLAFAEIHSFVGDGPEVLLTRSLAAACLEQRVEDVLPLYLAAYHRRMLETTAFYPGVLEALDGLRDLSLAVLTNKPGDLSRALLLGLGEAHRFALIWGGGDVPGKKPDPRGLLRLMAELDARPEETAMVGDSSVDMGAGQAAGCFTVGVTYGFDAPGVLATRPDAVLDDLRDLRSALERREDASIPRPE